jgi:hypothetical protein
VLATERKHGPLQLVYETARYLAGDFPLSLHGRADNVVIGADLVAPGVGYHAQFFAGPIRRQDGQYLEYRQIASDMTDAVAQPLHAIGCARGCARGRWFSQQVPLWYHREAA